ncbi:MAG TPA: amidohydrolase family protein [Patescibacteria group bacterium]|nr:amidohydrolase family protein [Patescibacteria group bacterium]
MKIDVFNHIFPKTFFDRIQKLPERGGSMKKRITEIPSLVDLDVRFRVMDSFPDYVQVISSPSPPIEVLGDPQHSPELAELLNDGLAELVGKHPDRFPAFIATLPMNNPDAAVGEIERAVGKLGATGIQLYSNVNGRPLDEPEFLPIFEKMAQLDLPIWIHPARPATFPDYQTEKKSKYELWWVFGWPYETSIAMARILFAGYFDRFPNLKIITHHMGAMVPYFSGRTGPGLDQLGSRTSEEDLTVYLRRLKKRPQDYFKMYYADTATFGAKHALQCGLEFFGADHTLFASDMPFDPEKGPGYIRETIRCIEELPISAEDRQKIYEGNARKLLRLRGM